MMHYKGLDLNLIVTLDVLLREKNVSAAARTLNLSQPAVSGALKRLREYFGDELLVSVGRQMIVTPRGNELVDDVRQILFLVSSRIETRQRFDPLTTTRQFRVLASDYACDVLIADAAHAIASQAPGAMIHIEDINIDAPDRLHRGEVDLLLYPKRECVNAHPHQDLFEDSFVIVACRDNHRVGARMSIREFSAFGHVVSHIVPFRPSVFESWARHQIELERRIEIVVPKFDMVPRFVMGTERISVMHRRHAEIFVKILPIKTVEPGFEIPRMSYSMQWHKQRDNDEGLAWFRERLLQTAARR